MDAFVSPNHQAKPSSGPMLVFKSVLYFNVSPGRMLRFLFVLFSVGSFVFLFRPRATAVSRTCWPSMRPFFAFGRGPARELHPPRTDTHTNTQNTHTQAGGYTLTTLLPLFSFLSFFFFFLQDLTPKELLNPAYIYHTSPRVFFLFLFCRTTPRGS